MVKVSHEVPISLLNESKQFNDYDYCLLHLTYEKPEYRNFYKESKRDVLLDNSLFELGDSLSNEQLAKGVLDIKPKWYVIPDCLDNATETIKRFKSFVKEYPDLPGLKIGVVHGKNIEELIRCYRFMSKHADKIAIPFDSKGFEDFVNFKDKLKTWSFGRRLFIKYLVDYGIWNYDKPHHLLGCSLAEEFTSYKWDSLNIESLDTSNPVVAGIINMRYEEEGLDTKPSIKLCELIDAKLDEEQHKLIIYNVKKFKEICENGRTN